MDMLNQPVRMQQITAMLSKYRLVLLFQIFGFGQLGDGKAALLSVNDQQIYQVAFKAANVNDWQKAHNISSRAIEKLPAKILFWMEATKNKNSRSFNELASFISKNKNWPLQSVLRRNAEYAMPIGTPSALVLKWFQVYPPITANGRIHVINSLLKNGSTMKAKELILNTWLEGNFGKEQERNFFRRFNRYLTQSHHIQRLDQMLWKENSPQSRRMFALVPVPFQKLASARLALKNSLTAVDWHIRQVPKTLLNNTGLIYERTRWRRKKNRIEEAYKLLRKIPTDQQYNQKWWKERSLIGRRLLEMGYITDAYRAISRHGLVKGSLYAEAEWLSGWIALRFLDNQAVASSHFKNMQKSVRNPISLARAFYWIGRSTEKINSESSRKSYMAASQYQTRYYGQLAAAKMKKQIKLVRTKIAPTRSEIRLFNADERVLAIRMLRELKQGGLIKYFFYKLNDETDTPAKSSLLADLAQEIDRPDLTVIIGRRTYREAFPMPDLAYPIIETLGKENQKALIHAIIRQESNFKVSAKSPSGALGLMQLLPKTARALANRINIPYSSERLLTDGIYNIQLGGNYLNHLLTRFNGSYVLAITSYNAGPTMVRKWIKRFGTPNEPGSNVIDWIESIPFSETRNYVQRVLENFQVYKIRLKRPVSANDLEKVLAR